jgi:hypothetical protein
VKKNKGKSKVTLPPVWKLPPELEGEEIWRVPPGQPIPRRGRLFWVYRKGIRENGGYILVDLRATRKKEGGAVGVQRPWRWSPNKGLHICEGACCRPHTQNKKIFREWEAPGVEE